MKLFRALFLSLLVPVCSLWTNGAFATTCPATTVLWTQDANSCSGPINAGDSSTYNGQYKVAKTTGSGTHGSAVFLCQDDGIWINTIDLPVNTHVRINPQCAPDGSYATSPRITSSTSPLASGCAPSSTCTALFANGGCDSSTEGNTCETKHCPDGNGTTTSKLTVRWVCSAASNTTATPICGPADRHTFTTAPQATDALCTAGTASAVSGTGPWSWTCTTTSSVTCSAESCAPFNGACDNSVVNGCIAPSTADDAAVADDSDYFRWACVGAHGGTTDLTCLKGKPAINGTCDNTVQNGCVAPSTPDDNAVADDASFFKWACLGTGLNHTDATNCQLAKPFVNASCDNSVINGCSAGAVLADDADSGTDYLWHCNSPNGGSNSAQCSQTIPVVLVNASCDNSTVNGCSAGAVLADDADSGTDYLWHCNSPNGGSNSGQCSHTIPINASCDNSNVNGCSAGAVLADDPDSGTDYLWHCNSPNGGANSGQCSHTIPIDATCDNSVNNGCSAGSILADDADSGTDYLWHCNSPNGGTNSVQCSKTIPVSSCSVSSGSLTTTTDQDGRTIDQVLSDCGYTSSNRVNVGAILTSSNTVVICQPNSAIDDQLCGDGITEIQFNNRSECAGSHPACTATQAHCNLDGDSFTPVNNPQTFPASVPLCTGIVNQDSVVSTFSGYRICRVGAAPSRHFRTCDGCSAFSHFVGNFNFQNCPY